MWITLSPSEHYSPEEIELLLADLRTEGADVAQQGIYGRRSVEELPPALWLIASFATGAIGAGFLNAMGADTWESLKRVARRAAGTRHDGWYPSVTIELEFEDCQVVLWSLSGTFNVLTTLDNALARLEATDGKDDLWYVKESDEWLTFDERLTRRVERKERL